MNKSCETNIIENDVSISQRSKKRVESGACSSYPERRRFSSKAQRSPATLHLVRIELRCKDMHFPTHICGSAGGLPLISPNSSYYLQIPLIPSDGKTQKDRICMPSAYYSQRISPSQKKSLSLHPDVRTRRVASANNG